jgi:hypothetical protein
MWSLLVMTLAGCGSPPRGSVTVSVEAVWRAFDADESAAKKQFDGYRLDLDGTLDSIAAAGSPSPTLYLRTPASVAPAFMAKGPLRRRSERR